MPIDRSTSAEAAKLRKSAEKRLKTEIPEQCSCTAHDTHRLLHELQVHQIELEMQNSELRKARNEVEQALQEFTDLYDFAPIGYFTLQRNGIIRGVNFLGARLLGMDRSRLIGRRFGLFVSEKSRQDFTDFLGSVVTSGCKESYSATLVNEAGDVQSIAQIEAVATSSGREIRFAVIDMTARNEIERKLINNSRLLAEAQRIAQLGSWHWDQITGEISGSEEFYRIFGQHFNSYQGFIALVHPDDRELVNEKVQDTLDNQSPYDIYYRIIPPDGDFKIIHAQGKAIKDHAGTVVRMMGIAQNITERRNTEEALSEKRRELTELNRSLELRVTQAVEDLRQKDQMMILHERQALMGDMINNIAHQWRQPLNALGLIIQQLPLINEAGDLSRELLKEKTSKSIELIKHMSRTIEDFMNFFRSDKECITFSVNVLIAQTLSLIEQSFQDIGIKITTQVESDLFVVGYPNEFAQVLLNVLFNARYELINKNINSPLISLCAFTEGDKTVVTITDNAGGISEDIIERVFDPYFSTKGPDGGSGLGLYMSKTIIDKNMGGRISVRNIGGGAELRIEVTNGGN